MEVTTTTTKAGKFEARFFHMVFEEEIGRVKGHFGPINSLKFHPNGKRYLRAGNVAGKLNLADWWFIKKINKINSATTCLKSYCNGQL